MAVFYELQEAYQAAVFLVYVTVFGFSYAVLAHLKEKGKFHYRAWVLPATIGNAFGALLSLTSLGRFLLHVRPTVTFYYILWSGECILALTSVYAVIRLWQSVKCAPIAKNQPPSRNPSEASADVWPPPPKPPT